MRQLGLRNDLRRILGIAAALTAGCAIVQASSLAACLTLDDALRSAMQRNPAIMSSQGQVRSAQGALGEEKSRSRLKLTGSAVGQAQEKAAEVSVSSSTPGVRIGRRENSYLDVSAEKLISSGGRVEGSVRQAEALLGGDELRLNRTRQRVALDTKSAFYTVLAAQRNVETAAAELQSTKEHLTVAEDRYKAETSPRYDVLRASAQNARAQQRLIDAQNALAVARQNLATVIGAPREEVDAAPVSAPQTLDRTVDELIESALRERPDLLAAGKSVTAAQAGLSAARAESNPSLSTSAGYRVYAAETPMQIDGWYAGVTLRAPIVDGGLAASRREQATGRLETAEAESASIGDSIVTEVKRYYADYVGAKARRDVADARQAEAQEAYRLAVLRYNSGVAPSVEIADAQSALTDARNELVKADLDIALSLARLEYATGSFVAAAQGDAAQVGGAHG